MDHRDGEHRRQVREWLKQEFNGDMVMVAGKMQVVGKITKGAVLKSFVERVMEWLVENYEPAVEALDPGKFKTWRDTIFPNGGPDNYIDYLCEVGLLKAVTN